MRLVLCLAAMFVAGPAAALLPMPECRAYSGPEAEFLEYSVWWQGEGFVFYPLYDADGKARFVLDDCRNDRRLTITPKHHASSDRARSSRGADAASAAVTEALLSETRYTMREIGSIARRRGAKTSIGQASYESCACELHGN